MRLQKLIIKYAFYCEIIEPYMAYRIPKIWLFSIFLLIVNPKLKTNLIWMKKYF